MPPKTRTAKPADNRPDNSADTTSSVEFNAPAQTADPVDAAADNGLAKAPAEGDAPTETPSELEEGPHAPTPDTPDPDAVVEVERGLVTEPCKFCYPDGWPVKQDGASANCAHDFAIAYGQQVEITRDRAVELGFIETD